MPELIVDFHVHSRYSRATSKNMTVGELAKWAKIKGIDIVGTGDFTHPLWLAELSGSLRDTGRGLYEHQGVHFMLTAEVNTLFYRDGRAHQIHNILFAPSIKAVERINQELESFGNLGVDGRPILRMEAWQLVEVMLGIEPRSFVVPAHAWTPHFSVFGSRSGFDTIEECFKHQAKNIFALETGLSSDPAMNWRLSALDRYALISNSDAHSGRKLGREANVFNTELDYDQIAGALRTKDRSRFLYTLEFFPEEGKYHFDGHRACKVCCSPSETKSRDFRCPRCERRLTVGVMHRVESLADRPEETVPDNAIGFKKIVPLEEIIAAALGAGVGTQAVAREYNNLIYRCGTEFNALLHASEDELKKATPAKIAEGIIRMREGRVAIEPGYDGEYGKVHIFQESKAAAVDEQQMTLF